VQVHRCSSKAGLAARQLLLTWKTSQVGRSVGWLVGWLVAYNSNDFISRTLILSLTILIPFLPFIGLLGAADSTNKQPPAKDIQQSVVGPVTTTRVTAAAATATNSERASDGFDLVNGPIDAMAAMDPPRPITKSR